MKKNNTINVINEHCYWVWYSQPINGESYHSVLTTNPKDALNSVGGKKKQVERVFNCVTFQNYPVINGAIV